MRQRSIRWTLLRCWPRSRWSSPAAAAATTTVGSTEHEQRQPARRKNGKQGGTLTYLAAVRRRLPRPGSDVLHVRLHGRLRDQPAAVLVQARTTRRRRCRTSPTATRRSRPTRRPITVKIKPASSTRRRSTARSRPRTSSTPSSAPSRQRRRRATPARTSPTSTARPTKPTRRDKPISGITDAGQAHARHQAQGPAPRRWSQALVMPITIPVPKEYAYKFDSQEPVDVRPVRRLHRPVHGEERPRPARSSAATRASRSRSSATRTGTRTRTTGPPTWTRSTSRRATTT